ncbi:MAG: replicative DNA helicase [Kiritimatiellaeota bacterium]|nr:replicative DNA helicase [Kiritimatiellota bacterium]
MAVQVTPPAGGRSDRLPPYSEEAERGVLGSILLDAERVVDLCRHRRLSATAFYLRHHQVLFETVESMLNEKRPVDLLTVGERLRDLGQLEGIGGPSFLEQLVDSTPTSAHAGYYVGLVHEKFLLRLMIDKARATIETCYASQEEAGLILNKAEQDFFEIAHFKHGDEASWDKLVKEGMARIEQVIASGKNITGLATGFADVDRLTQGLQPGDLVILAARPSMGKTSLGLNIAENVALMRDAKHAVAVFSLEMSAEQLVRRMICSRARVSMFKLSGGYVSAEMHGSLVQATDVLMKAQIFIDDTAGLEVLELRSRARRLKRKYDNISLIVVDYLQLLHYPQYSREGRQLETAAISGALKAMAKELHVPVLCLSQLSRAPEQRDKTSGVPRLSDLRDSGAIEQDADVVFMLRRPCKYPDDQDHDDKRLAVLELAKQRNGPTGETRLNFEEDFTRFEDRLDRRGAGGDA